MDKINWQQIERVKTSITIEGHATSFSVERPFLTLLKYYAHQQGLSLSNLVKKIDCDRSSDTNLSAAIRLYILKVLIDKPQ